ncbi:hypothetical protein C5B97_03380 [Pseudoclavibacter sp. RFBB5]|nr:hypothetical protein C5B97_03380 [Pseudoclavibacter sp. RFBB5]
MQLPGAMKVRGSPPAAAAALGAGLIRDTLGTYTSAWWGGAALCIVAGGCRSSCGADPPRLARCRCPRLR